MLRKNIAIIAFMISIILTMVVVILRLIGILTWERHSAVGWGRFFTEEVQPYADIVQVLMVAIIVSVVTAIFFYAWNELGQGKRK